jgi:hypothetical protein
MKIRDLFLKPIDRNIEGVIKADDDEHLFDEIDEYVITNEITQRLYDFLDYYKNYSGVNGAWISGFFGSGKSHLLKILSYVLENKVLLEDIPVAEIFLPKLDEEPMLKGAMEKAISIPSRSILFNIDQKADVSSKQQTDAVLSVFMKVFNEMRGYNAKIPSIAQFEYDMDKRNELQVFKETFREVSGQPWEQARDDIWLESGNFATALSRIRDITEEEAAKVLDRYESSYQLSIEDFALQVKEYIDSQKAGFRLNFLVDEVGQYIADNVKLMTNLQTIAESLATKCHGQAWLIVTSQEDMENVIGNLNKTQFNDFSKIQDRFKCRMQLTGQNVAEVVRKRLLRKNPQKVQDLADVYDREKNNFRTLFQFSNNPRTYSLCEDQEDFIEIYPFMPMHFELLQSSIRGLSEHNAFEGKHRSVGERSMLGVFQDVGKMLADNPVGEIATFDLTYDGMKTAMKSQLQTHIYDAERHLSHYPLAIKVLKTLLMVKYVKEFRSTARNISILLIDRFNINPAEHEKAVQKALGILEEGTYLRRNGDVYEYLTDDEKDIEREIKNTEVDQAEVCKFLASIIYKSIIKDSKIRYEEKDSDYPFNRLLDDAPYGNTTHDLSINFITPLSSNYDSPEFLKTRSIQHSELIVRLGEDKRLADDLYLYNKTEKYCRITQTTDGKENIRRILSEKAQLNQELYKDIETRVREAITRSTLYLRGEEIDITLTDPKTRISKAFERLISTTYLNLRMLDAGYKEEKLKTLLTSQNTDSLFDTEDSISEAEKEMINSCIMMNKTQGIRTTVKSLIDFFSKPPYGWWSAGTRCVLAKLFARGKVDIKEDSNFLSKDQVLENLLKTNRFPNTIIEPRANFSEFQVRYLKTFHKDLFNESNNGNDAKEVALLLKERLEEEVSEIESLINIAKDYPFVDDIRSAKEKIKKLTGKEYSFYLEKLKEYEEELLDTQENVLDPFKIFMNGEKKKIYDSIKRDMTVQEPNYTSADPEKVDQLRSLMSSHDIYRNNNIKTAKDLNREINDHISDILKENINKALLELENYWDQIEKKEGYAGLTEGNRSFLKDYYIKTKEDLSQTSYIFQIQGKLDDFKNNTVPEIYSKLDEMATPPDQTEKGNSEGEKPKENYVSIGKIKFKPNAGPLATEDDVDSYLDRYKKVLMDYINDGKKIIP